MFWKEYWKENNDMIKENLLERKEENREKEAKSDRNSIEKEIRKEDENEENSLIGEEDIHVEKVGDVVSMYQAGEETEDFIKENQMQDNMENGDSVNETAAGKEDCFQG